jgi:hypothetical protein
MIDVPAITLRYFDCRGRMQPFRYYLRLRNIPFVDARISLKEGFAAWQQVKNDPRITGPFLKLPVMHWGELQLSETSVIHDWLHSKLGDEARLDEQARLQHAMLSSSCRSELMSPLAILMWQELMYPGTQLSDTLPMSTKLILGHVQVLEATLQQWQWFAKLKHRPLMLADCLLWEVLSVVELVFADKVEWNTLPGLQRFYHEGEGPTLFRHMLAEHPCQFSGRPQEAEALQRIHAALGL